MTQTYASNARAAVDQQQASSYAWLSSGVRADAAALAAPLSTIAQPSCQNRLLKLDFGFGQRLFERSDLLVRQWIPGQAYFAQVLRLRELNRQGR